MRKFLFRSIVFLILIFITIIIYLTYFGIKTEKFDNLIKTKANSVNKTIKIDFYKTKIYLNPIKLNLIIKLQNPNILIKKNTIKLKKVNLFLSIKSILSSSFILNKAEIGFIKNDIKDLTKITSIYVPRFINNKINKIFHKGSLEGEFSIPFNADGSIDKNYAFYGKISDATINLSKKFSIKNLTTEIKRGKNEKNNSFLTTITKGFFYNLDLSGSSINLLREKEKIKISSLLITNGKFNLNQAQIFFSMLDLDVKSLKDINGDIDLKTNINFYLNNNFKIKDLDYKTEGNVHTLQLNIDQNIGIKKYLPEYKNNITLKNTKIKFIKSKKKHVTKLIGFFKIKEHFDEFVLNESFNNIKRIFNLDTTINLKNSKVSIANLNFEKQAGKQSKLSFNINFILGKFYNIKNLDFSTDKTKVYLSDIKLNNSFEVVDLKKAKVKTFSKGSKNNDFLVNKSNKKIVISGKFFDAQPLLKSLYKKNNNNIFSKKFSSEIKIDFDRVFTGTNDDISEFSMISLINQGSYEKLSLKGNFSENEIIEMSLYKIDESKKTLQVISDRARPFVKHVNFIKGFEGGKLEYESIISKDISNSNLIITDFKVSKVPALAKLLTLASLRGIADTLSGEGIRFESFEMKSNSKENIFNIEEALAFGPAVSILLEGYVDKGKTVSLRGTLVPATKLNSIIASIPILGNILVGKKTGEGVVGVSFKMKGPPSNVKTTVNPIKTLTPRFIVRAVESMKKNKKKSK